MQLFQITTCRSATESSFYGMSGRPISGPRSSSFQITARRTSSSTPSPAGQTSSSPRGSVVVPSSSCSRTRAEREQRKISSVLRTREAAVRSTLCPLALCDTDGRIQYANPAGLAAWGYADESEVVGRHVSDFVVSPGVSPEDILDLIEQKTW